MSHHVKINSLSYKPNPTNLDCIQSYSHRKLTVFFQVISKQRVNQQSQEQDRFSIQRVVVFELFQTNITTKGKTKNNTTNPNRLFLHKSAQLHQS